MTVVVAGYTAVVATPHFRDVGFSGFVSPPAGGFGPACPSRGKNGQVHALVQPIAVARGGQLVMGGVWDSTTDMISL